MGTLDAGLVLYLSMSEGNDLVTYDKTKQQNHGAITEAIYLRPYEDMSNDSDDEGGAPLTIIDDGGVAFWTLVAGVEADDTSEERKGVNCYKVTLTVQTLDMYHDYGANQDWTQYDYLTVWIYGCNTADTIRIEAWNEVYAGKTNGYFYAITDDFTGWQRFMIPLERFTDIVVPTGWDNIRCIRLLGGANQSCIYYFDRMTVDTGNWRFGEALDFDGTNDYVNCGNANSLCPIETISISAWICVEGSGHRVIISRYSDNANNKKSWLINAHTGGKLEWNVYITSANSLLSNLTLPTNEWVHIVCTFDGTTQVIYINGLFDISQTPSAGNIQYTTTNTLIGALYNAGDAPALFYNGLIDEVRIYNRILTPEEIRTLYELVY